MLSFVYIHYHALLSFSHPSSVPFYVVPNLLLFKAFISVFQLRPTRPHDRYKIFCTAFRIWLHGVFTFDECFLLHLVYQSFVHLSESCKAIRTVVVITLQSRKRSCDNSEHGNTFRGIRSSTFLFPRVKRSMNCSIKDMIDCPTACSLPTALHVFIKKKTRAFPCNWSTIEFV